MALSAGTRLGPYEIVARIGAGGMGEVYRARDTRLDRIVAIKCLTGGGDVRGRLVDEARAAAALNHPNICTVHEIAEIDQQLFIAWASGWRNRTQDPLVAPRARRLPFTMIVSGCSECG